MVDVKKIEEQIKITKEKLLKIGEMRPGSLSMQSREYKGKYGSYWQLSYTHMGKGRTVYIRNEFVKRIKKETGNYQKFRKLIDQLVSLYIDLSQKKMDYLRTMR